MRHRVEESGSESIRRHHRLGRLSLAFKFLALHRLDDLGCESPEDHPIVCGQPSIEQHQDRV